jgi:hypothetical protein
VRIVDSWPRMQHISAIAISECPSVRTSDDRNGSGTANETTLNREFEAFTCFEKMPTPVASHLAFQRHLHVKISLSTWSGLSTFPDSA